MDLKTAKILTFLLVLANCEAVYAAHSEIEPNNTRVTANPYVLGIPMSGQITSGEEDWFYFETLADHLVMDIFREGEFLTVDVFNSGGDLLYSGAGGESLIANIGLETAGKYFIRLRNRQNSDYQFTVRLSDESDCDNCPAWRGDNATYDPLTGELFLRTVDVPDRYGKAVQYEVLMQQVPGMDTAVDRPLLFEVIKAQRIFK